MSTTESASTTAYLHPDVKRAGDMLVRRIKAKDALLAAYRAGVRPTERTFHELEITDGAVATWAAVTAPSAQSVEKC